MKNLSLKILLAWCLVALCPAPSYASTTSINEIIFFGDSLSDNGNLYTLSFGIIPKSPPYFNGRFSDGPIWTEVVAKHFQSTMNIDSSNYAIGGESVLNHNSSQKGYSFMLMDSVRNYLLEVDPFQLHPDFSHNLYVILMGANDYLWGSLDPETDTTDVTNGLKNNIENLIDHGAQNFVLLNLPDLSIVPFAREGADIDTLKKLTILHNQKLSLVAAAIQKTHPTVKVEVFDYYGLTNNILADPATYNEKYNTHITNTTDACYKGSYLLTLNANEETSITKTLEQIFQVNQIASLQKHSVSNTNYAQMARSFIHNPVLASAYIVGLNATAGVQPCADPSSYLFWDMLHPTAQGHAITGKAVTEFIEKNFITQS